MADKEQLKKAEKIINEALLLLLFGAGANKVIDKLVEYQK